MPRSRVPRLASQVGDIALGALVLVLALLMVTAFVSGARAGHAGRGSLPTFRTELSGSGGDLSGLLPGDQRAGRLQVSNQTDHLIAYAITVRSEGNALSQKDSLADALWITLSVAGDSCETAPPSIYAGLLRDLAMPAGGLEIESGATATVCFSVMLPASTGNQYQGSSASLVFAPAAVGELPVAARAEQP